MNQHRHNSGGLAAWVLSICIIAGCAQNHEKLVAVQPATVTANGHEEPLENAPQVGMSRLQETWGIQVESTRLSAGGYMIDFRYRVLDTAKAAPILDRAAKPYLVDQATGAKFIVPNPPKVGQLRSGKNIKEGTIYFVFFANPARYVKSGNKVTVVIGDCEIKDIVVQ